MSCIFCKIIAEEVPCYKVFENENILAFLDVHPCAQGHTVVIPKKHIVNAEEISVDDWNSLCVGLKQTIDKIQLVVKAPGMNVGFNNNSVAGQVVPHLHWHIIPRFDGDGGGSMHSIVHAPDQIDVENIAKLFL
ncbi:MAG: HIT family protein [Candidatus Magasanikbacteria bacterium]